MPRKKIKSNKIFQTWSISDDNFLHKFNRTIYSLQITFVQDLTQNLRLQSNEKEIHFLIRFDVPITLTLLALQAMKIRGTVSYVNEKNHHQTLKQTPSLSCHVLKSTPTLSVGGVCHIMHENSNIRLTRTGGNTNFTHPYFQCYYFCL